MLFRNLPILEGGKTSPAPDPSGRPKLHFDSELKGFGVLCSGKTSSKSYIIQKDLQDGKTRRVTIGACNVLSLENARAAARETLALIFQGGDPKAAVKRQAPTLRSVFADFLASRPNLREASRKGYSNGMGFLADWLDLPLAAITREMVETRHKRIAADVLKRRGTGGASSANGAMRILRVLWNYASDRYPDLPANPVKLRKQWFAEPRRETHVAFKDLPRFYEAIQNLPNDVARDYLLLLLFTGLRRSEAASLTWADIDLGEKTLRIPASRTKANRALTLPLSDFVFEMLRARRAIGKTAFVFPSSGRSGHIVEPKFPLRLVANECGVQVSAHDLRRTFLSVAESCDIGGFVLKVLANHSITGDVTGGYIMPTPERLREPVQRITDKLKHLCVLD